MPTIPLSHLTDGLRGSAEQAFHAMEKLRDALKEKPNDDGLNLLNSYVQHSPACSELIDQIKRQEFQDNDKAHVFALDLLCRIMDDQFTPTSRTESTKNVVSVKILEDLKVLYRLLNSDNHFYQKTCLRTLSLLAKLAAPLLLAEFNFDYKPFLRLGQRKNNIQDKTKHVRSFYLLFAKTLLQSTDSAVVVGCLRIPRFIQSLFRLIADDHPPYVVDFVTVVHTVLNNRQIPRSPKKQLFNGEVTRHLSALLEHQDAELALTVKNLLQDYFTSTFFFRMYPKEVNSLFDLCTKMRPLHQHQQELVLAVLKAHPHLYAPFLSKLSLVIYPRLSSSWLLAVRFLSLLLRMERGDEDRVALTSSSALELCLPKTLNSSSLTQGILHQNPIVRDATISLLESVLLRAKNLSVLLKDDVLFAFRRQLLVALPDLHSFLALVRPLSETAIREEPTDIVESSPVDLDDSNHSSEARIYAESILPLIKQDGVVQWVQCVHLYLNVLPSSLRDCKFDWTKILITDELLLSSKRSLALLSLVETAFLNDGRFLGSNMSKHVQAYLQYLVNATVKGVEEAKQALHRLLDTFSIFDDTNIERAVWIEHLCEFPPTAPFFVHVVIHLTNQPGYYITLSHDIHCDHLEDRPSLFYLAAVHQYSLGFPRNIDASSLLHAVSSQLAVVSPKITLGMMRITKYFEWKETDRKRGLRSAVKNPDTKRRRGLVGFVSLLQSQSDLEETKELLLVDGKFSAAECAVAVLSICDAIESVSSFKRKLRLAKLITEEWVECLKRAPSSTLGYIISHPCWDNVNGSKETAREYRSVHFGLLVDVLSITPNKEGYARLLEGFKVTPRESLARKVVSLSAKHFGLKNLIDLLPQVEQPIILIRALVEESSSLSELVSFFSTNKFDDMDELLLTFLGKKSPACWVYRLHHLVKPESFDLTDDSSLFVSIARLSSKFRAKALKIKDRFLTRLALLAPLFETLDDVKLLETNCDGVSEDLLRRLLKHHPTLESRLQATVAPAIFCLAEVQGADRQRDVLKSMDKTDLHRWIPRFCEEARKNLAFEMSIEIAKVLPSAVDLEVYGCLFETEDLSSDILQILSKLWERVDEKTSWRNAVLEKVRSGYTASLSEDDCARSSILMREAKRNENFEFHLSLARFDWSLDGIRLRETLDTFFSNDKSPDVYDLSFLLPFFYARLHTEFSNQTLPLRLVCQGGILQVLLYGLATDHREWAYRGLSVVESALQQGLQKDDQHRMAFREVPQITLMLESLRNAIPAPTSGYPMLPPLICAFMATATGIMLRPDHSLYLDVGRFFLARPFLDLEDVPMFCRRFYSERSEDRTWIIKVLRRGGPNWSLFARRHVVQSVLSFAGSILCDFGTWADSLRFLCTLHAGVEGRLEDFGAAEWIVGETRKTFSNEKLESIALEKLIEFFGCLIPRRDTQFDVTPMLGAALSLAESSARLKNRVLAEKLWPHVLSLARWSCPTIFGEKILSCFESLVEPRMWAETFHLDARDTLFLCRLALTDSLQEALKCQRLPDPECVLPVGDVVTALGCILSTKKAVEKDAVLYFLTIPVDTHAWKVVYLCALLLLKEREVPETFFDLPHPLDVEEMEVDHSSKAYLLFQYAYRDGACDETN